MKRTCEHCGADFDSKTTKAKFCSAACRAKAHRGQPSSVTADRPAHPLDGTDSLVTAVRAELQAAKRASTPIGLLCIQLAHEIESGAESASGLAALSKELSARLGEALANVTEEADAVDELQSRRARRAAR